MFNPITSHLRIACAALVFTFISIGSIGSLSAGSGGSEVTYVELYANVLRAVDSGRLDSSTARKVHSLNADLQKKLLALDDRLKAVKTASMKATGSKQDELLDELVALGAERERLYLDYHNRLEQLTGTQTGGTVVSAPVPKASSGQAKAQESGKNAAAKSSQRTLTIESVPEDISTGQFD